MCKLHSFPASSIMQARSSFIAVYFVCIAIVVSNYSVLYMYSIIYPLIILIVYAKMFFRPHFNTKQSTSLKKKKPLAELSYHELLVSRNSLQIHLSCCYCAALALLGQGPEAYECFQSALMYFSRWLSVIETWEGLCFTPSIGLLWEKNTDLCKHTD